MKNTWLQIAFLMTLLAGCADLDANIHNRRHCTVIDEKSCTDEFYWDRLCTACEDEYEFNREYQWQKGMLEEGETVRDIVPEITEAQLLTEDFRGTLFVYFIPSHGEDAGLANTTIVYNNGNFANIEHYVPRMRFLHEAGYNLVVWDYRGYGKSMPNAVPKPAQFLSDARLVWEHARTVAPDPAKMISYGYSLGGIPAVEMAVSQDPCALMLEAAFPSMSLIIGSSTTLTLGEEYLSAGLYNNVAKLKSYTQPAFFFHGDADVKFPLSASKKMFESVAGPKDFWTLPGVGHSLSTGGIPEADLSEYLERLRQFLETYAPDCLSEPALPPDLT